MYRELVGRKRERNKQWKEGRKGNSTINIHCHFRENLENIEKEKEEKAMTCLIVVIILSQV